MSLSPTPKAEPPRHQVLATLLLAGCVVGLAVFVVWLMQVRFTTGDVYPAYSSFRADPLGTKALHEALDELPDLDVRRNLKPWTRFHPDTPGTAILVLGTDPIDISKRGFPGIEAVARWLDDGHRVVVLLRRHFPGGLDARDTAPFGEGGVDLDEDEPGQENGEGEDETASEAGVPTGFFGLRLRPAGWIEEGSGVLAMDSHAPPFWRGSHVLEPEGDDDPPWETLATVGEHAIYARRSVGEGELILYTDVRPLSNEALWKDRHPDFLTELLGPATTVVFDESHLGTTEQTGIVNLIRRLRLHGLLLAGVIVLVLLLWQGLFPLAPVDRARDLGVSDAGHVGGHDAVDGLVALLRRSIPARDLPARCLSRWEKNPGDRALPSPEAVAHARALADKARPGTLPETYQAIRDALDPRARP